MKINKLIFTFIVITGLLTSCDPYEDYVTDYDYTSTYFGTQKPLRTIVDYDDMSFEVGVAIGGMRVDDGSHTVNFMLDTNLLNVVPEAAGLTAMPEAYYSLGHQSSFNIVKDHMRVVKVTLNKEAFTSDVAATNNTYAIPLRINGASVDSIPGSELDTATIASKDITILVVKYISKYSGSYYSKGVQYTLDAGGIPTDTVVYHSNSLSQNTVKQFTTDSVDLISTTKIGGDIATDLQIVLNSDMTVGLSSVGAVINSYDCTFQEDENSFYMDLNLTQLGTTYHVIDTLIQRQAPELDLRFEEW